MASFLQRIQTAFRTARKAVFLRLRIGEPEPWDTEPQEEEKRTLAKSRSAWDWSQTEPWEEEEEEQEIIEPAVSRLDDILDKIQRRTVSASEAAREAEFLDDGQRQVVFEEVAKHLQFSEAMESAIEARNIEAIVLEAGTAIDDYLDQLWARGDEGLALELAEAYEEFIHAQGLILASALDAGEKPSDWIAGDVSHIVAEAHRLGYIADDLVERFKAAADYLEWQEKGIEVRVGEGEGKFVGTVVAEDVEAYVSSIAAPVYIVEGEREGSYDVYVTESPGGATDAQPGETLLEDIGEIETKAIAIPGPQTSREQMRSIAQRTLKQYGY